MDKLLNWSLAHQLGDKDAIAKVGDAPDPKLLNQLFGGPDEPGLMKQLMQVVSNDEATEDAKVTALENFEMLIENLDNANAIGQMGFWPTINSQLQPDIPETRRILAASIVGIATQNNPMSQQAFHDLNGLGSLVNMATDKASVACQLKALFAITLYIRHFEPGYTQFADADGWQLLAVTNVSDKKVMLRTLSLVSAILSTGLDAKKLENLHKHKLVDLLTAVLQDSTEGGAHAGCVDKALVIIGQLADNGFEFTLPEINALLRGIEAVDSRQDISEDDLNAAKAALNNRK